MKYKAIFTLKLFVSILYPAKTFLAASNLGTPDTSRNLHGFTTRFYADEGNFDLLCNHIPVFFVRDAIRVSDAISHLAPSPVNNMADPDHFWSLFAKYPEATNMLTWFFSDRRYVKYHWIPLAGEEFIMVSYTNALR